ncbi:MAG TPA: hypothetical protein VEL12_16630 [Candidatus Nitrosopolaris sp.]|nr:hypothetical protein [Candidatus Nitrosopolaris sp.]
MAKALTEQELRAHYSTVSKRYTSLCEEAMFILEPALQDSGIRVAMVEHRVKTEKSFVAKGITKQVSDFGSITDVAGIRVICLFISDLPRLGEIIRASFDVIAVDDKVEGYSASQFGYMSVHYLVQMKASYVGPRYERIGGLPLEIQIRTLLMHSWANVSHYLSYKSDTDIPDDLKHDFNAISGLFYMADKHFELFFQSSVKSREAAVKSLSSRQPDLKQDVNLDSMTAYLAWKFPDRSEPDEGDTSQLVAEVLARGYTTLERLNAAVDSVKQRFDEHEKVSPPADTNSKKKPLSERKFAQVGVVRVSLKLKHQDDPTAVFTRVASPKIPHPRKSARTVGRR